MSDTLKIAGYGVLLTELKARSMPPNTLRYVPSIKNCWPFIGTSAN